VVPLRPWSPPGAYTRSHFSSISAHLCTVSYNLTHECVLELLKLSSNVNECKPLVTGTCDYIVKLLKPVIKPKGDAAAAAAAEGGKVGRCRLNLSNLS